MGKNQTKLTKVKDDGRGEFYALAAKTPQLRGMTTLEKLHYESTRCDPKSRAGAALPEIQRVPRSCKKKKRAS